MTPDPEMIRGVIWSLMDMESLLWVLRTSPLVGCSQVLAGMRLTNT